MSYRAELHSFASAQMKGLPFEAIQALAARTAELIEEPWDAVAVYPDDPSFRRTVFGEFGVVSFHLDDKAEVILIYGVWAG
ncbi:hypothetical protein Acor_43280 [Acrocarpospora corrugata]|uniref:DUF4258 domain-containing protein n=1 Tax=Acrocarpospora corrugata TaxID=35763 RepID=A0A5M3W4T2_9ACTN|nr:hypothetical protein [Acrocarpospora corrugata]GES02263.1 hypothetical protein Acor_43280 [Acrocarpospora corrugata]